MRNRRKPQERLSDFFEFFILGQGGPRASAGKLWTKWRGGVVRADGRGARSSPRRECIYSAYIKWQVAFAGGERLLLLPGAYPPGSFRKERAVDQKSFRHGFVSKHA